MGAGLTVSMFFMFYTAKISTPLHFYTAKKFVEAAARKVAALCGGEKIEA